MADSLNSPDETSQPAAHAAMAMGNGEESPDFLPVETAACDDAPPAPKAPLADVFSGATNSDGDVFLAELLSEPEVHRHMVGADPVPPRRRRVMLPLMLFVLTCFATFFAGASKFQPEAVLMSGAASIHRDATALEPYVGTTAERVRLAVLRNWRTGLIYMTCVLAILLTHEMGHFLATIRYRISASYPYFIPVPITPIGTMGAVIGMDGLSADRRQMFDIGLAGPIAGLIVAIPITWIGIQQLDLTSFNPTNIETLSGHGYHLPVLMKMMLEVAQPPGYRPEMDTIPTGYLNPFLMAGWVGLLITGLNMLPISQLDGGHVIYALFGKSAHVIARTFLFVAIFLMVVNFDRAHIWMPMLILVTLIGTDHPPTADDGVPLGRVRTLLGFASLTIPLLCFPAFGLRPLGL